MIIKDVFSKPIDRGIQGVIKVAQQGGGTDGGIRQELEEYVVTRELQKHFASFFSSYKKGIIGDTDRIGVWISGFFGSGKSHFLKILSYLLENKEVDGKRAIEYFVNDGKIADPMVLADMKLCADVADHTDIILFNIDSKSDQSGKHDKDAIVNVFLKVFNEKLGFCGSIPYLADLERNLSENNRYDEFKKRFNELNNGKCWEDERNNFDFIQDKVIDVLIDINFMKRDAATIWCGKATGTHNISIDDFSKLVKKYIDSKGGKHHVVFLADEVGQYIGEDSKLMLNLQTVTEELGTKCEGKAWVIVTSQQDIDSITKGMNTRSNDFSKIQGRFDTRIALSSADVDEVIKKRILAKTSTADQTLTVLYEQKETVIKNLIIFRDSPEKKIYSGAKDFVSVYPFVQYQFDLLADVLTSIRTHGASGKHLSEGERSMLALFKESAENVKNENVGAIVPFNLFYNALHQFLDHSHKGVIEKAYRNEHINPDKEESCFTVDLLKALFMIKYVDKIESNVDNLTSLMVNSVDSDRIALKQQVEKSLKILVAEKLVQKNGDKYTFLTDEEQETNRTIDGQVIESAELIKEVSDRVFDDIYKESRFKHPNSKYEGRYIFGYDQMVDGRPRKSNQKMEIGLNIITPNNEVRDGTVLRLESGNEDSVYFVLPEDPSFLDELIEAEKIKKFLMTGLTGLTNADRIRNEKNSERTQHLNRSKSLLIEALRNADIYVGGSQADIGSKDVTTRINEALTSLVNKVFNKLSYIDSPKIEDDVKQLIRNRNQKALDVMGAKVQNAQAIKELSEYINSKSKQYSKVSLKTIITDFNKKPYGFNKIDVEWILVKLFLDGDLDVTINGTSVTQENKESDIVNYFTNKDNADKLQISKKKRAGEEEKKAAREVMEKLFEQSQYKEDDDGIWSAFKTNADCLKVEILDRISKGDQYPGKEVLKKGKDLLTEIIQARTQSEFFGIVYTKKDDLIGFTEEYSPIDLFFSGSQKKIFDNALAVLRIYDDNWTFIDDSKVKNAVDSIKEIVNKASPYAQISELPDLVRVFNERYKVVLDEEKKRASGAVSNSRGTVIEELDGKPFKDKFVDSFNGQFDLLDSEITSNNSIADLKTVGTKADSLKINLLKKIIDEESAANTYKEPSHSDGGSDPKPKPASPKKRVVSVRNVISGTTWYIQNESDIDKNVEELKKKLKEELEADTVLQIEF